ncbi:hypothetical protein M0R45_005594 [Rubus argutus]|uniref:Uncharacterized protein n=1 Tax=Rubus argutus TaxID=59490 RepID=A0AAW1YNL4_RUBAR
MVQLHLSFLFVAGFAFIFQQVCEGKVMMEYIGASGVSISFDQVPINDEIDFHFLLGFAIDADASGNFQKRNILTILDIWINPESVAAIKKATHVKVMASLSGWSVGAKSPTLVHPRKKLRKMDN